tara:strand:+ start:67 stop:924 length:858 start_codon:yes stop_codon:yes gene_type:complete
MYYSESLLDILFLSLRLSFIFNKELYYLNSSPARNIYSRDYLFFKLCGFRKINGNYMNKKIFLEKNLEELPYGKCKESTRLCKFLDINFQFNLKRPLYKVDKKMINQQKMYLKDIDLSKKTIALGIGGKLKEKRWAIENYILLLKKVIKNYPETNTIIFGGKEDSINAEKIVQAINNKNIISLAGKTSIIQSIASISLCDFYVGNDCGVMHIASMMGLRCAALFSIHQKRGIWEPFGKDNLILRSNIDIDLREKITLKDAKRSMDLISINEVYIACKTLMNSKSS